MLFQELSYGQVLGLVSTVKLEPGEQTKWTVVHRRNICTERHKFPCSHLLIRNRPEIFKESRIVQTSEKTRKSGKNRDFYGIYNIMGSLSLTSVLVDASPSPHQSSSAFSFSLPPTLWLTSFLDGPLYAPGGRLLFGKRPAFPARF